MGTGTAASTLPPMLCDDTLLDGLFRPEREDRMQH